jgi:hypothetical protein
MSAPVILRSFSLALALLALGCNGDDVEPLTLIDAGSVVDAGVQPDAGPPPPLKVAPTRAITAGGGRGANANYKVRLIIGGPQPTGAAETGAHKARLGAGAVQHGQNNDSSEASP